MTREMPKNEGGRPTETGNTVLPVSPASYTELDLDKMSVSRWQAIASVPEQRFEEYIEAVKEAKERGVRARQVVVMEFDLFRDLAGVPH